MIGFILALCDMGGHQLVASIEFFILFDWGPLVGYFFGTLASICFVGLGCADSSHTISR